MAGGYSRDEWINRIIEEGIRRGFEPHEIASILAIAAIESGIHSPSWKPNIVGDRGTSFGLFQINTARFPSLGLNPQSEQDKKRLLDPAFNLSVAFKAFEHIHNLIKKRRPEFLQIDEKLDQQDKLYRMAMTTLAYLTWWNRPAYVDEVLSDDLSRFDRGEVYPKVPPQRRKQLTLWAYQEVQKRYNQILQRIRKSSVEEAKAKIAQVLKERDIIFRAPSGRITPSQIPPLSSHMLEFLSSLPQYFRAFSNYEHSMQSLREQQDNLIRLGVLKERLPQDKWATIPDWNRYGVDAPDLSDNERKYIQHILANDPVFLYTWNKLSPQNRLKFKQAILGAASEIKRKKLDPQSPNYTAEVAKIFRTYLGNLGFLYEMPPFYKRAIETGWTLLRTATWDFLQDYFFATAWSLINADDARRAVAKATNEMSAYMHRRFGNNVPVEYSIAYDWLRRNIGDVGKLQPEFLANILWGLSDIFGGTFAAASHMVQWLAHRISRGRIPYPKILQTYEQFMSKYTTDLGNMASIMAQDENFRRRHRNDAIVFLNTFKPDQLDPKTGLPTRYGWFIYAQHVLMSAINDLMLNTSLAKNIPEQVKERMLLGFHGTRFWSNIIGVATGVGTLKAAQAASRAAAEASSGVTRLGYNILKGISSAGAAIIGGPVDILTPQSLDAISRAATRVALRTLGRMLPEEGGSWFTSVVRKLTSPATAEVARKIASGVSFTADDIERSIDVLARTQSKILFAMRALDGSTMGAFFLAPETHNGRDIGVGMLAGVALHMTHKLTSLFLSPLYTKLSGRERPKFAPELVLSSLRNFLDYVDEDTARSMTMYWALRDTLPRLVGEELSARVLAEMYPMIRTIDKTYKPDVTAQEIATNIGFYRKLERYVLGAPLGTKSDAEAWGRMWKRIVDVLPLTESQKERLSQLIDKRISLHWVPLTEGEPIRPPTQRMPTGWEFPGESGHVFAVLRKTIEGFRSVDENIYSFLFERINRSPLPDEQKSQLLSLLNQRYEEYLGGRVAEEPTPTKIIPRRAIAGSPDEAMISLLINAYPFITPEAARVLRSEIDKLNISPERKRQLLHDLARKVRAGVFPPTEEPAQAYDTVENWLYVVQLLAARAIAAPTRDAYERARQDLIRFIDNHAEWGISRNTAIVVKRQILREVAVTRSNLGKSGIRNINEIFKPDREVLTLDDWEKGNTFGIHSYIVPRLVALLENIFAISSPDIRPKIRQTIADIRILARRLEKAKLPNETSVDMLYLGSAILQDAKTIRTKLDFIARSLANMGLISEDTQNQIYRLVSEWLREVNNTFKNNIDGFGSPDALKTTYVEMVDRLSSELERILLPEIRHIVDAANVFTPVAAENLRRFGMPYTPEWVASGKAELTPVERLDVSKHGWQPDAYVSMQDVSADDVSRGSKLPKYPIARAVYMSALPKTVAVDIDPEAVKTFVLSAPTKLFMLYAAEDAEQATQLKQWLDENNVRYITVMVDTNYGSSLQLPRVSEAEPEVAIDRRLYFVIAHPSLGKVEFTGDFVSGITKMLSGDKIRHRELSAVFDTFTSMLKPEDATMEKMVGYMTLYELISSRGLPGLELIFVNDLLGLLGNEYRAISRGEISPTINIDRLEDMTRWLFENGYLYVPDYHRIMLAINSYRQGNTNAINETLLRFIIDTTPLTRVSDNVFWQSLPMDRKLEVTARIVSLSTGLPLPLSFDFLGSAVSDILTYLSRMKFISMSLALPEIPGRLLDVWAHAMSIAISPISQSHPLSSPRFAVKIDANAQVPISITKDTTRPYTYTVILSPQGYYDFMEFYQRPRAAYQHIHFSTPFDRFISWVWRQRDALPPDTVDALNELIVWRLNNPLMTRHQVFLDEMFIPPVIMLRGIDSSVDALIELRNSAKDVYTRTLVDMILYNPWLYNVNRYLAKMMFDPTISETILGVATSFPSMYYTARHRYHYQDVLHEFIHRTEYALSRIYGVEGHHSVTLTHSDILGAVNIRNIDPELLGSWIDYITGEVRHLPFTGYSGSVSAISLLYLIEVMRQALEGYREGNDVATRLLMRMIYNTEPFMLFTARYGESVYTGLTETIPKWRQLRDTVYNSVMRILTLYPELDVSLKRLAPEGYDNFVDYLFQITDRLASEFRLDPTTFDEALHTGLTPELRNRAQIPAHIDGLVNDVFNGWLALSRALPLSSIPEQLTRPIIDATNMWTIFSEYWNSIQRPMLIPDDVIKNSFRYILRHYIPTLSARIQEIVNLERLDINRLFTREGIVELGERLDSEIGDMHFDAEAVTLFAEMVAPNFFEGYTLSRLAFKEIAQKVLSGDFKEKIVMPLFELLESETGRSIIDLATQAIMRQHDIHLYPTANEISRILPSQPERDAVIRFQRYRELLRSIYPEYTGRLLRILDLFTKNIDNPPMLVRDDISERHFASFRDTVIAQLAHEWKPENNPYTAHMLSSRHIAPFMFRTGWWFFGTCAKLLNLPPETISNGFFGYIAPLMRMVIDGVSIAHKIVGTTMAGGMEVPIFRWQITGRAGKYVTTERGTGDLSALIAASENVTNQVFEQMKPTIERILVSAIEYATGVRISPDSDIIQDGISRMWDDIRVLMVTNNPPVGPSEFRSIYRQFAMRKPFIQIGSDKIASPNVASMLKGDWTRIMAHFEEIPVDVGGEFARVMLSVFEQILKQKSAIGMRLRGWKQKFINNFSVMAMREQIIDELPEDWLDAQVTDMTGRLTTVPAMITSIAERAISQNPLLKTRIVGRIVELANSEPFRGSPQHAQWRRQFRDTIHTALKDTLRWMFNNVASDLIGGEYLLTIIRDVGPALREIRFKDTISEFPSIKLAYDMFQSTDPIGSELYREHIVNISRKRVLLAMFDEHLGDMISSHIKVRLHPSTLQAIGVDGFDRLMEIVWSKLSKGDYTPIDVTINGQRIQISDKVLRNLAQRVVLTLKHGMLNIDQALQIGRDIARHDPRWRGVLKLNALLEDLRIEDVRDQIIGVETGRGAQIPREVIDDMVAYFVSNRRAIEDAILALYKDDPNIGIARMREILRVAEEGEDTFKLFLGGTRMIEGDTEIAPPNTAELMNLTSRYMSHLVGELINDGLSRIKGSVLPHDILATALEMGIRRRGAVNSRLIGAMATIALGATLLANSFPGLGVWLDHIWQQIISWKLAPTMMWLGAATGVLTVLFRALKLGRFTTWFGDSVAKAEQILSGVEARAEKAFNDAIEQLARNLENVGETERAAIVRAIAEDLKDSVGTVVTPELLEGLSQRLSGPIRVVSPSGRSIPIKDARDLARDILEHAAVTVVAATNQQMYQKLFDLTDKLSQRGLVREGLKIAVDMALQGNNITDRLAIALARKSLLRLIGRAAKLGTRKNWAQGATALGAAKVGDLIRSVGAYTDVDPTTGKRVIKKITPDMVVIDGRRFSDMTVQEATDLLLSRQRVTPFTWSQILTMTPSEVKQALRDMAAAVKDEYVSALIDMLPPEKRRAYYASREIASAFNRLAVAFNNPDIASALANHPSLQVLYFINLLYIQRLLGNQQLMQLLGPEGQEVKAFVDQYISELRNNPDAKFLFDYADRVVIELTRWVNTTLEALVGKKIPGQMLYNLFHMLTLPLRVIMPFTATRATRIALTTKLPRDIAEQIVAPASTLEANLSKAWADALNARLNVDLLNAVMNWMPTWFRQSSYIASINSLLRQSKAAKRFKPVAYTLYFVRTAAERTMKEIAQQERVKAEELFGGFSTMAYSLYTAAREGDVIKSLDEALSRGYGLIENPTVRDVLRKHQDKWLSLAMHSALWAHYITHFLSHKALTGEWLLTGKPRTNIVEMAYFPQAVREVSEAQNFALSLVRDWLDFLFSGAEDEVEITRVGVGKRFWQIQRTGRGRVKHEQFFDILTNFARSIVSYNELLPYANYLKAAVAIAPRWLQPFISSELSISIGRPLGQMMRLSGYEVFAEQLVKNDEIGHMLLTHVKDMSPMLIERLKQRSRTEGLFSQLLDLTHAQALSWNLQSILRQPTTLPYTIARLVADFHSPEYALIPFRTFMRSVLLASGVVPRDKMTALERMLYDRLGALRARHAQTERAVRLYGISAAIALIEHGEGRKLVDIISDPAAPIAEKERAINRLMYLVENDPGLARKFLDWGMSGLQLLDEAMVWNTALSGALAKMMDIQANGMPLTEEAVRMAVDYGAQLAETIQASPSMGFMPIWMQAASKYILGRVARQFVTVGFAVADNTMYLYSKMIRMRDMLLSRGREQMIRAALEYTSAALAFALLELGLHLINSSWQATTGRTLEEIPIGYPPDEESKDLTQLIAEIGISATPRAIHRLWNILTAASNPVYMGHVSASYTDIPPLFRVLGDLYASGYKTYHVMQRYKELKQTPVFSDEPLFTTLVTAYGTAPRIGGELARKNAIADMLMTLSTLGVLVATMARPEWGEKVARGLSAIPSIQIQKMVRVAEQRAMGSPMPAELHLPGRSGEWMQAVIGAPFMHGVTTPINFLRELSGTIAQIRAEQTSSLDKATMFMHRLKSQPIISNFIGLQEWTRRANSAVDFKSIQYLLSPTAWVRLAPDDSQMKVYLKRLLNPQNEGDFAQTILTEPANFVGTLAIFGPQLVLHISNKQLSDRLLQYVKEDVTIGVIGNRPVTVTRKKPQIDTIALRQLLTKYATEAQMPLIEYITTIAELTNERNITELWWRLRANWKLRDALTRKLTPVRKKMAIERGE